MNISLPGLILLCSGLFAAATPGESPLDLSAIASRRELSSYGVLTLLNREHIDGALGPDEHGLRLDLSRVTTLNDGTSIQPSAIYGTAYFGPYPFAAAQAAFAYKRFRAMAKIQDGKSLLEVGKLLKSGTNSEGWGDSGDIAVRLELFLAQPGADRALGVYDTFAHFRKTRKGFVLLPAIVDGPRVCRTDSRRPGEATIVFGTDQDAPAAVHVAGKIFHSPAGKRHEVKLFGLPPQTQSYQIELAGRMNQPVPISLAPADASGPLVFAFLGDSREGYGGGERAFMGANLADLEKLGALAFRQGAAFLVAGGDFVDGYTASREDLLTQFWGSRQAMAGFWRQRPIFAVLGNHDSFIQALETHTRWPLSLDRRPYETDSSEAVFAQAFCNPDDAPPPADPRLPPYRGAVYTMQQGFVRFIVFNNNYWYSPDSAGLGGSPEGYIMEDQLRWVEAELRSADQDPTVRYIFLAAHMPAFPSGGHVDKAMWHDGDNRIRAHVFRNGGLEPEKLGIVEVRNRLALAAAASAKVAAVLGSDEHSYHRVLIDKSVPAGDPTRDDKNHDGRIDWKAEEPASPIPGLKHPVWYLTSGGAGAPYYSEEPSPWADHWRKSRKPESGFRFSAQQHVLLFRAGAKTVSLRVLNPNGEIIDEIADLMSAK